MLPLPNARKKSGWRPGRWIRCRPVVGSGTGGRAGRARCL